MPPPSTPSRRSGRAIGGSGLAAGDLVLCSGTLARDVGLRDRVEAAAGAGFAGISLWGRDYQRARDDGFDDAGIRSLVADHGLSVAELDPAWWWLPGAHEIGSSIPHEVDPVDVFRFGPDDLFAIAEAVGARSVNAVDVFGGEWSLDQAAAAFAGLCDRAAEHGLLVHVEWLPWSRIPDLATAWDIVRSADRPNGGLNVDAWHWFRRGPEEDLLRSIPGDRIFAIQLDDAPAAPEPDLLEASLHERRLPGDGDIDLTGLLSILRDIGSVAPVGVEVFSDELHALDPAEAARRAADSTRRVLDTVA